jgi:ankyrin repeat protein
VAEQRDDTPLHVALRNGQLDVARLLIDKGADINKAGANGDTPLQSARQRDMARLLIDKGAQ